MNNKILILSMSLFGLSSLLSNAVYGQRYKEMIREGNHTVQDIRLEAEAYFKDSYKGRGSGYKQWKRWEYDAQRMSDGNGIPISKQTFYSEMERYNKVLNDRITDKRLICPADWKELGPKKLEVTSGYNPGIGRVTSISLAADDANHIIVGSQTGGVWQSLDAGSSWVPLTDFFVNMDVYSLAIDPHNSNTYYWGSEGLLFKSTDRGQNWTNIFNTNGWVINKIMVHPLDSNVVFISDQSDGIFKSEDGGNQWKRVFFSGTYDIEFHPTDSAIVYVSGNDVYVSLDVGESFEQKDFFNGGLGPVMLDVSKQAPDHLYLLQSESGRFGGYYKSVDTANTWEALYLREGNKNLFGYSFIGEDESGQAPRDMDLFVSDTDTNDVYIAGINLWRSMDDPDSFQIVSHWIYPDDEAGHTYTHADTDILVPHEGILYVGSDGGIFKLETPWADSIGRNFAKDLSNGLSTHQFYRIGVAQSEQVMVGGGSQDNGSTVYVDGEWRNWFGADGMESFVVDNENKTLFGTYQNGGLLNSYDQGRSYTNDLGLYELSGSGFWVTPFEKDPNDTSVIYVSYDSIYRSDNLGQDFKSISQSLNARHFKIAPSGSDTIYATSGSSLIRTYDGGQTPWRYVVDLSIYGGFYINSLAIHPNDAKLLVCVTAGSTKVLLSRDGGENWIPMDEGLPNFSPLSICWDDTEIESLYLGMNYGVYHHNNLLDEWLPYNMGLPNVRVNELEINYVTEELYAGTYGRGLWVSPLCRPVTSTEETTFQSEFEIKQNPIAQGENLILGSENKIKAELRLFDQNGRMVYRNIDAEWQGLFEIETRHLSRGIYFLRMNTNSHVTAKKLIVQ